MAPERINMGVGLPISGGGRYRRMRMSNVIEFLLRELISSIYFFLQVAMSRFINLDSVQ